VRSVFEEASGVSLAHASPAATFNELGLDSLSLTQCAQLLAKRLGCKVTFRQLSEELVSLGSLAAHLEKVLPDEVTLASSLHVESSRSPLGAVPEAQTLAFSHDAAAPPVPGARLGRDRHGNPTWYVPHPENPSKYVMLSSLVSSSSEES
jgi:acyl carrier protein